jgi:putative permease
MTAPRLPPDGDDRPSPPRARPRRQTIEIQPTGERWSVLPGGIYPDLRRAIFLAATLYLLYQLAAPISAILLLFLFAFILAAVLNPVAARLQSWGVPRMLSAVGLVLLALAGLALIGWLAVPPLLSELGSALGQFTNLEARLTAYYQDLLQRYPWLADQLPPPGELVRDLTPRLASLVGHIGRYGVNLIVGVVSLVVLLVLVIYIVGKPDPLVAGLLAATPELHRRRVETTLRQIMDQLQQWALGSAFVGLIVGVITGLGLHLLGVPYALLFGVLAAIGELIPNLGPILASFPPVLLALTIDPVLALWTLLFFIVLQQVESHLITPLVLGGSLQVHPVSLMFAILVMGTLFGLIGALLAVPVSAIIKVCWEELYLKPRHTDPDTLDDEAEAIVTDGRAEGDP